MSFKISHLLIETNHPILGEPVEAEVSFYYTKGYAQTYSEPGCEDSVELLSIEIYGDDLYCEFTPSMISDIEYDILDMLNYE